MKKEIFFCDDDSNILYALKLTMHKTSFKCSFFQDPVEMLDKIEPGWGGVIFTDLNMPGVNGFEVIERVSKIDSEIPIIVLTGNGDIESVVRALRAGAYDFLEKPISKDLLIESTKRALEKRSLRMENQILRKKVSVKGKTTFLGQSASMKKLKQMLTGIAATDANVLIVGETGTGKEVTARYIHENSERVDGRFTAINCGAVPDSLIDSELFGHEAGAFTGASKARKGKIEETNRGTLFLDEVNSMPMTMQIKLLRVLEERVIEKLGSNKLTSVDVRIIAASQTDLKKLVEKGQFREDLYYRLNVIPVKIPALRNRREDIPILFSHFTFEFCNRYKREILSVDDKTLSRLMLREWTGNVRELKNSAERFVITGQLMDSIDGESPEHSHSGFVSPANMALPERVGAYEKFLIEEEFKKNNGAVEETYTGLGLPRKTLYDKIKKYGIDRKAFK